MNLPSGSLLFALPALALVLGLIWLASRIARWFGLNRGDTKPSSHRARLRLVESLRVDASRHLVLVSCDGREALVLTGSGADTNFGWLPVARAAS